MKRSELKKALRLATGCGIQHTGWPCGTCFFSMSKKLSNCDWQAVLLKRGDYRKAKLDNLPLDIELSLQKTLEIATRMGAKRTARKKRGRQNG